MKLGHIIIQSPTPAIDGGRYPVKRIVGDVVTVEADVVRDGHSRIHVVLLWQKEGDKTPHEVPMTLGENDRWQGTFTVEENALYRYSIEAWTDVFETWLDDFRKHVESGAFPAAEAIEGALWIEATSARVQGAARDTLSSVAQRLRETAADFPAALAHVSENGARAIIGAEQERVHRTRLDPWIPVFADRPRARVGAWYELFVRSQGSKPGVSGTFADATRRLPEIRDLGFDVVYLAPIHPIGHTARKGPNGALVAGLADPGCPWAIGSEQGGHTAVDPALGTLADFDRFVAAAKKLDMEVALDFAIQCSPDHPWVREHPDWFYHRPDGSIKCAENPPFRYDDIYPLNFDTEKHTALWNAMRDVLLFWIGHGVKAFRIDNPHTKPFDFWEWLLSEIRQVHPDVIFLGEAFTRPKIMFALSKVGFTQSYTYFTWRNTAPELKTYITELTTPPVSDFLRPNLFTNTPDVLSDILQKGGRPAFRIRLTLAATLSPSYGIYSGYELCENNALPGTEEYKDSEKFEIRLRDWSRPGNINDDVTRLNRARRENPALQTFTNIRFCEGENPSLLTFVKATNEFSNVIIVVVTMDPFIPQQGHIRIPADTLGLPPGSRYRVTDLLDGKSFEWGDWNFVRFDPQDRVAHVLRVDRL